MIIFSPSNRKWSPFHDQSGAQRYDQKQQSAHDVFERIGNYYQAIEKCQAKKSDPTLLSGTFSDRLSRLPFPID